MASISANGSKGHHKFTLNVTQSATNVANNTSTLSFDFKLSPIQNSWNWEMWNQSIAYTVTINGTKYTGYIPDYDGYSVVTLKSGTQSVTHNADGTKSISFSFSVTDSTGQYYTSGDASASGSMTLTTIPRATTPTFSAKSVTMGSSITITMTPAATTFKHKLRYSWSTLTQQTSGFSAGNDFTAQGTTTATFTPPTTLANYIPNGTSGTCTVSCYTYDASGNHIGTVDTDITLAVPSYTPSGSIAITGNSLLSSTYVQGKSTMGVTITASTSYGATITGYSSVVDGKTYTGASFTTSALSNGSKSVVCTITDSRGKTAQVTSSSVTVYEYAAPKITSFTLARQSTETTVIATVNGSISSVNSKNAKTIKVTLNGVTNTITASSYTISGTTTFTNVPTDSTLVGTAAFTDSFTTVKQDSVLPTVAVTMDFYKDGKGVAFGKVAETSELLDVNWSERIRKNLTVDGTLSATGNATLKGTLGVTGATTVDGLATVKGLKFKRGTRPTTANIAPASDYYGSVESYIASASMTEGRPTIIDDVTSTAYNGHILHFHWDNDGGYDCQLFLKNSNGSLLTRGCIEGVWGNWKQMIDTNLCKDYVIETGSTGIWDWSKWKSGRAECWGNLSITPTTGNATNSYTVTLPFDFINDSSNTFKVQITPAKTALYIGSYGDCNSSNNLTHTTTTFVMSYKYTNATPYNVSFNLHVSGKWK